MLDGSARCTDYDIGIQNRRATMGRAVLLWLLGVPIPIIIILALLWH
jgi:hypothetical protein